MLDKKRSHRPSCSREELCFAERNSGGPRTETFGSRYDFSSCYSVLASTAGQESFVQRPAKKGTFFGGGGGVCFSFLPMVVWGNHLALDELVAYILAKKVTFAQFYSKIWP